MVFSSLIFLFSFLPIVLFGNWMFSSNRILQNSFLLVASLFFYAWGEVENIKFMLVSIGLNYVIGILIHKHLNTKKARIALVTGIILNLALLIHFKYILFIVENLSIVLNLFSLPTIKVTQEKLPIGISFYTFQALSYIIDVYRKDTEYQKNPLNLGLYIALFPQLIAGPIVRYNDIAEDLIKRTESINQSAYGIRRFVIGLSKKVLLANNLGAFVDQVFDIPPESVETSTLWVGVIAYSLQLYYDFSGYSDMAIGLGRMFGFNFPENFNFPYIAQSIQDFWRRWHITLSVWFRDYLYIPLGGNRVSKNRVYINLFIVFLATGLWHGASWNFVIWGLFHGFFIILERAGFSKTLAKLPRLVRHSYTLLVVLVAWVLFRATDIEYGLQYISHLFSFDMIAYHHKTVFVSSFNWFIIIVGTVLAYPIFRFNSISERKGSIQLITFDLILITLFLMSVSELISSSYNPFIYFRF